MIQSSQKQHRRSVLSQGGHTIGTLSSAGAPGEGLYPESIKQIPYNLSPSAFVSSNNQYNFTFFKEKFDAPPPEQEINEMFTISKPSVNFLDFDFESAKAAFEYNRPPAD